MAVLRWLVADAASHVSVRALAPRASGDVTLSVGSIAAIVLGVVVFTESIVLYCVMRRNSGSSSGGRTWYR